MWSARAPTTAREGEMVNRRTGVESAPCVSHQRLARHLEEELIQARPHPGALARRDNNG